MADLTAVASFVQSNNVPILFVALLLLQFLSMVVDRLVLTLNRGRAKGGDSHVVELADSYKFQAVLSQICD